MNIKKVMINLLVIVAAFAIFAFWYHTSIRDLSHQTASLQKVTMQADTNIPYYNYKIYLITNEKQFQFWDYMNQGVSDMSELLGLSYKWEAPEHGEISEQIEILNQSVRNGADAILISTLDAERLAEPIRDAKANGVKIIYVNSAANEEGIITLATNNYDAGRIAATNMIEELELSGVQMGEIGIVSVTKTNPTIIQRDNGFIDVIKEDGRYTILEPVYTEGNPVLSEEAASRIIQEHEALVGLFGTNEGASVGVGNAIKADNNRITGIGFDKSDITMELLDCESLKVLIAQNPYTMGYLGMAEAFASLKGYDTGPSYIDTGVSVIRKR